MPRVTFGWRVPDWPEPGENMNTFRDDIFRFMDTLHEGGLDSAWVGDHVFPWSDQIDQKNLTIEAWTTITYLMARYPRMRMGTIVLSQSYRPPALLAKMAAVAQWLSNGRFILGIGAGWKENEYRAYGYDYPPDGVRISQLEETVQIIRKMWTEDEPTFQGKYYQIDQAYCFPRPDPLPPLLIGGSGPKRTLKLVAQYADWCNINGFDLDLCQERLNILREHCQVIGRNYDEIVKTLATENVAIAPTHEEAVRKEKNSFFQQFLPFVGTPDEVSAKIQQYVDLGITHFMFRLVDFPRTDGVELFLKEVMPRFA